MKIIGIVGKFESGKTTLARMMAKQFPSNNVSVIAFADALKLMIVNADICTVKEVFVEKTPFSRMIMQKIGTGIFRDQVDENFWVKKLDEAISGANQELVIVHDVRFLSEAKYIKSKGGILIRITREGKTGDDHRSETEQDSFWADHCVLNDGSFEDLKAKAKMLMNFVFQKEG